MSSSATRCSGSNSLVEILQCHPSLQILNEPFNENFHTWEPGNPNYRDRVHDIDSLDGVLAEILAAYSGIKVLSYQLTPELLDHLVLRPDLHVIVLRRRNLLAAAVSNLVALQTNLWKTWDAERRLEEYYQQLEPLDIDDVRGVDDMDEEPARRHGPHGGAPPT